jgi:hypothetical protein
LLGRPVGQGLVGPLGVVVVDVSGQGCAGFLEVLEGVEPGAFATLITDFSAPPIREPKSREPYIGWFPGFAIQRSALFTYPLIGG